MKYPRPLDINQEGLKNSVHDFPLGRCLLKVKDQPLCVSEILVSKERGFMTNKDHFKDLEI